MVDPLDPLQWMNDLQPVECPHEFDRDLDILVVRNHALTMEGIERIEREDFGELEADLANEDHDIFNSQLRWAQTFYEDLRRAARNMAVVGLVTRFDHWVGKYHKRIPPEKHKHGQMSLTNRLHDLNNYLGAGPVPIDRLEELVTVRNSVTHNNSKVEWEYQKRIRRVAARFVNAYEELEVSEDQLAEAIESVKTQVKWYEQRLWEREASTPRMP